MYLNWNKCQGNVWCKLNNVDLNSTHFVDRNGVFIVWHGGVKAATVTVGHGNIKDAILHARSDYDIQKYKFNTLYITWADVVSYQQLEVERYLINTLSPLIVPPNFVNSLIVVNLPW